MTQSNIDAHMLWACGFIGSKTESNKVSSISIGAQDTTIWPITSQNIIHQCITNKCKKCIQTQVYDRLTDREFEIRHCEGVLIPKARLA
jgi:hypothetical protein